MATETRTQRVAAGNKAAATRKRNAAKRSASRTKSSATQTRTAARTTARSARSTAGVAGRTAGRRADAAASSFEALVREAERALVLIPVGAALEVRDAAVSKVRTYADRGAARREFNRFERRGEKALRRR
jgi:guanyl-specific ribonuclease Sa